MTLATLVRPPAAHIDSAFSDFAGNGGLCEDGPIAAYRFGQTTLVLFELRDGVELTAALEAIASSQLQAIEDPNAFSVLLVPLDAALSADRRVLRRGIAAVPTHSAIAEVVGLPEGWRDSQMELCERALSPLFIEGELRSATLYGKWDDHCSPIVEHLKAELLIWESRGGQVLYLKAEAGKGKSTAFAEVVWREQHSGRGPLPLLFPLRSVPRGTGISWSAIAASVGIVGTQAAALARAVQCGLVSVFLDGLDEVAGRYDPVVVSELLDAVRAATHSPRAKVAISGRTTEAFAVRTGAAYREIALELPSSDDSEFVKYVRGVVDAVVPTWPSIALRVPEPPLDDAVLPNEPPSMQERRQIIEWILRTFDDLGKERSLFFAQSLACMARTYQLAGNKPLVITSGNCAKVAEASVFEVCVLAAALASIREQDKIEDLARGLFAPARQLEILTWLALRASVEDSLRDQLPSANELAKEVFKVDPVNQNEEFTAIVRQLQKHALLFVTTAGSAQAGDWRPQFLSDWIRSALLCRAWLHRAEFGQRRAQTLIESAICRSQRAALAFSVLIPDLVRWDRLDDGESLAELLTEHANQESPEAAANYWHMFAGLSALDGRSLPDMPSKIPPMTDLTSLDIAGATLDHRFSGSLVVFVDAEFENVVLENSRFEQCDFSNATFRGCKLYGVVFESCDGPVLFENCVFESCSIRRMRGRAGSLLFFTECEFDDKTTLVQDEAPNTVGWAYTPIVVFEACRVAREPKQMLQGDWLGVDPRRLSGLTLEAGAVDDPVESCARAMLRPFFPVRAGVSGQRQARGYIRSSALGRGQMPAGAPSDAQMRSILEAFGFSSGGRQAHIYAPWSGVGGATAEGVQLRNELLAFLTKGERSERVKQLLERLRQSGSW